MASTCATSRLKSAHCRQAMATVPVGNGRKLPRFCGKYGLRPVECGKCEICKSKKSLFLRLFEPGLLKWGSGGRWFESSRPDIHKACCNSKLWQVSFFRLETARKPGVF